MTKKIIIINGEIYYFFTSQLGLRPIPNRIKTCPVLGRFVPKKKILMIFHFCHGGLLSPGAFFQGAFVGGPVSYNQILFVELDETNMNFKYQRKI